MEKIRREYFKCSDDSNYSEMINRWVDHDGFMMKWACKIFDQASIEETKKKVPFEKNLFYFYVNGMKIIVSYENLGNKSNYNVCLEEYGCVIVLIKTFYELLKYLYTERVETDLVEIVEEFSDSDHQLLDNDPE